MPSLRWSVLALVLAASGSGCTHDDIVYRDAEPFNPPPDSVLGFLGYYVTADKQTTCGNCHAGAQASWVRTAHANAWAGLQSSDHAAEYCEGCHTVNELGNASTAPGGHNVLKDEVYRDVQCESCHGPGVDHVSGPGRARPLASIAAEENATNGCGECHNGEHHPFVEQWAESRHGNTSDYAKGTSPCSDCHEGKAALEAQFGVTAEYLERGTDQLMDITCAVCHDPHGGPNPGQLRAPISEATENNLCVRCHNRRTTPSAPTRGPHAAQGPLVFGEGVGWVPPGFESIEGLTGAHGNPASNPGLCASCHVAEFTVVQPEFFQSVGHTFEAVPCLDADGIPTLGPCSNAARSFGACTTCHGTEANSRAIYEDFREELGDLLSEIWTDNDSDGFIDAAPVDRGLLPSIVASAGAAELDVSNAQFTFAEGVLFNAQLAATDDTPHFLDASVVLATGTTVSISGHPSSGNGVHNPPFLKALLRASISAAASHYGLPHPAGTD